MAKQYLPKVTRRAGESLPHEGVIPRDPSAAPFITIAQQIGAECSSLPGRLTKLLAEQSLDRTPWTHWDQQLVEKVSSDNEIPRELIDSLETSGHSWIDDLLNNVYGRVDEMVIFTRVKNAVRDLARAGHVILIGHGSTYMTRDLPGGLDVRLIAPLEFRIARVAERFKLSHHQAARHMRRMDRQRRKFFRQFWPGAPLAPEIFAATLNVAELDEARLTHSIAGMMPYNPRQAP